MVESSEEAKFMEEFWDEAGSQARETKGTATTTGIGSKGGGGRRRGGMRESAEPA